jgi:hypothetical protein
MRSSVSSFLDKEFVDFDLRTAAAALRISLRTVTTQDLERAMFVLHYCDEQYFGRGRKAKTPGSLKAALIELEVPSHVIDVIMQANKVKLECDKIRKKKQSFLKCIKPICDKENMYDGEIVEKFGMLILWF